MVIHQKETIDYNCLFFLLMIIVSMDSRKGSSAIRKTFKDYSNYYKTFRFEEVAFFTVRGLHVTNTLHFKHA